MGYVSTPTDLTGYKKFNNGNYVGNATQNRAIPHGMINIPDRILIFAKGTVTGNYGIGIINQTVTSHVSGGFAVTAIDGTNFYTGAGAATYELNQSGVTYYWEGIKW